MGSVFARAAKVKKIQIWHWGQRELKRMSDRHIDKHSSDAQQLEQMLGKPEKCDTWGSIRREIGGFWVNRMTSSWRNQEDFMKKAFELNFVGRLFNKFPKLDIFVHIWYVQIYMGTPAQNTLCFSIQPQHCVCV